MAKKNKQTHMSKEDVKLSLAEEKEQLVDKECAMEIEAVLKAHGRGLQAYWDRSTDIGILPRIRLVRIPPNTEEENGEEETEG